MSKEFQAMGEVVVSSTEEIANEVSGHSVSIQTLEYKHMVFVND